MLVTITDKRNQHVTSGAVDYYEADIATATDYYPFGMGMVGREFMQTNNQYRYGFNGKEKSNEVYGEGNVYDYGFRIYNPRLGRFLSTDPLIKSYPCYSPYQFAGNKPIAAIDLDGLEEFVVIHYRNQKGKIYKTEILTIKAGELVDQNIKLVYQGHSLGSKTANGNVLVFDVYNEGDKKNVIYVVDENRNTSNSDLTSEEYKLYKQGSKLMKADNDDKAFAYPNDEDPQYQSDEFNNPKFYIATALVPKLLPKIIDGFTSFDFQTGKHYGSWKFGQDSKNGKVFTINNEFDKYLSEIKKVGNVDEINIEINIFEKSEELVKSDSKNTNEVENEFKKHASQESGVAAKNIKVHVIIKKGNSADDNVKINVVQ